MFERDLMAEPGSGAPIPPPDPGSAGGEAEGGDAVIGPKGALLAGLLMVAGLALWWNYGLLVVLAEPAWFCLPR